ncbi:MULTISPECIES: transposase [unclassified Bradyrhizobium]|uniref:transposase n=1 Tax=unclassified Bradyrhizobium TaxID=2631580 RepID=UPI001FF77FBD|nr:MULTISPECIES: transposase [unclassified Bradyrhizobium]
MIIAQREQLTLAKSEVTVGRLEIERLKLMLAKARREQFGQSSERGKLLVEQLELRRPCSTTLATGLESTRKAILPAMWA